VNLKMESSYYHRTIRKREDVGRQGEISSIKFTPDGKYIVCASKNNFEIWDFESGNQIRRIKATTSTFSMVNDVAVSPDGQYIITGIETARIKVWDFSSGKLVWEAKTKVAVLKVDVSVDGKFVIGIAGTFGGISIWNLETGEVIDKFKTGGFRRALAISSDNNYIVYSNDKKSINIWDITARTNIREFKTKKLGEVYSLVITPDMNYVISGSWNKLIRIWDFSTGELIKTLDGHKGPVFSLTITPDGKYLVSGSRDRTIKIWEISSGQLTRTLTGHKGSVDAVTVSRDGKYIASGSTDQTIKIWELP
jgi:WD40 repeat protein